MKRWLRLGAVAVLLAATTALGGHSLKAQAAGCCVQVNLAVYDDFAPIAELCMWGINQYNEGAGICQSPPNGQQYWYMGQAAYFQNWWWNADPRGATGGAVFVGPVHADGSEPLIRAVVEYCSGYWQGIGYDVGNYNYDELCE